MPVGMLLMGEGMARDAYKATTEQMYGTYPLPAERLPEGLLVHVAGDAGEGGWYIYDIWESHEDWERYRDSELAPALEKVTGDPAGARPEPVFFDIEVLVRR